MRPYPRSPLGEPVDLEAAHGTVFVMPYETNLAWTHEVPCFARDEGRRVSVTLRACDHLRGLQLSERESGSPPQA